MRIKPLSIKYFTSGRIAQNQKHEDRKTVLYWIRKITAGENYPPVEVSFLTGSRHLTLINGYHRLKALTVLKKDKVNVLFTPRKAFNKSLFQRGFSQKDYTKTFGKNKQRPRK